MSVSKEMRVAPLVIALALAGCGGGASVSSAPEAGAANPTGNAGTDGGGDTAGTDGAGTGAEGTSDSGTSGAAGGGSEGSVGGAGGATTGATSGGAGTGDGVSGGSTDGTTDGADGGTDAAAGESLEGRVADGYIRGATVCVDLNENEACDADEPFAVTGDGGVYELVVPAGAADKPIVAAIPPEAIDEDTGEAVGETLVFTAPGSRPDFVSPMTTLVHEELRDNPAFDVDEAERVVRGELGLDDAGDVSLFEDYVAAAEDGRDADRAERFRYLHETARVAARLMGDIRARIEEGANEEGIDIVGDADGRRAVEGVVREELRRLLPDIAREVAVRVDADDTVEGHRELADFERERIAGELYPEDRLERIDERLRTEREALAAVADAAPTDMSVALTAGLSWIELDCHADNAPEPPVLDDAVAGPLEVTDADMTSPELCVARSGHVALDGDALAIVHSDYDGELGIWVERDEAETGGRLALVDGEWVAAPDVGPVGPVSFGADGEALVDTDLGQWRIRGLSIDLGGKAVTGQLWRDGALAPLAAVADDNDLFDGGAMLHPLVVEEPVPEFVLPNLGRDEICPGVDVCDAVTDLTNSFAAPPSSLEWLREGALQGIDLGGVARERLDGLPVVVSLSAEPAADGTLPVNGKARWRFVAPYLPEGAEREEPMPPPGSEGGELPPPDGEEPMPLPGSENGELPPPDGEEPMPLPGSENGELPPPDGEEPMPPPGSEGGELPPPDGEPALFDPTELSVVPPADGEEPFEFTEGNDRYVADAETIAEWRLIEVDGVTMIELDLPLAARHRLGLDGAESLVLVEQGGFVRAGVRTGGKRVREHLVYDASAFATLRDLAERFFGVR